MNTEADALKLSPEMASRRLLVLKFVRGYIEQWGESPSLGEIAAGLRTSRSTANKALTSLVQSGLLLRRGRRRGLMLPDQRDGAIRQLRELGYSVDEDVRVVTKGKLPRRVLLDYPPRHGGDGKKAADRGR